MFDTWVLHMLVQKWDEQNMQRKITGIAANDCHQNVGVRAVYTEEDSLLLLNTGHNDPADKINEFKLNFLTRTLLRLCFGALEPNKQVFRIDLDPYERSSRFVNTHLLANDLTEPALLDALRAGRAFIAFNMIADAEGFMFMAEGGGKQVVMGESIPLSTDLRLRAEAPLSCTFRLLFNGKPIAVQTGSAFEYEPTLPGKYRIEASLPMPGELNYTGDGAARNMAPWVFTNPIELTAPETTAGQ